MNAISPLVLSSRYYKIAAEFLKAGIHDLRENIYAKNIYAKFIRVKIQLSK
jgi:hypothetical protein